MLDDPGEAWTVSGAVSMVTATLAETASTAPLLDLPVLAACQVLIRATYELLRHCSFACNGYELTLLGARDKRVGSWICGFVNHHCTADCARHREKPRLNARSGSVVDGRHRECCCRIVGDNLKTDRIPRELTDRVLGQAE